MGVKGLKDWVHIWIQQSLTDTVCVYLIMGQNIHVDKESKVSKDALQKSDGQINRYMKIFR